MPTEQKNQHIHRHLDCGHIAYRRVNNVSTCGPQHNTTCIMYHFKMGHLVVVGCVAESLAHDNLEKSIQFQHYVRNNKIYP
jgi:hypothetical protein